MPPVVLSVLAHPDDAEFLCAGTLIRLTSEHGWQVHVASMTPGDCGSTELPAEEIAAVRRGLQPLNPKHGSGPEGMQMPPGMPPGMRPPPQPQ